VADRGQGRPALVDVNSAFRLPEYWQPASCSLTTTWSTALPRGRAAAPS